MIVPNIWFGLVCLLALCIHVSANIDLEEKFCGKKLTMTLRELCAIYNYPSFGRNRLKRQIVDECCTSPCSRRYLVQYYCHQPKSSIVHLLLTAKSENASKSVQTRPPKSVAATTGDKKNSLNVGNVIEDPSSHPRRFIEGKRRCKCRKRRAKRVKKIRKMFPVPAANIGHVEHSQSPFYVWKFSRMLKV